MADCQETAGFLFKHACENLGSHYCATCQKFVCDEHCKQHKGEPMCVTCVKKALGRTHRLRSDSGRDDRGYLVWYTGDPYFYSESCYLGYGQYGHGYWGREHHDRDDFTEADSESFQAEGDEGFEQDMGAS